MGDAAIRETDNDAAVSRLSAVNAGYLEDPYASCFVKRALSNNSARRPPLINLGTFLRTWAIDQLVNAFLDADTPDSNNNNKKKKKQIVSLGAGTDTRYFRLARAGGPRFRRLARYVEVDFAEATSKKAMVIRKNGGLSELLRDQDGGSDADARLEKGGTSLISSKYALLPGDLRSFARSDRSSPPSTSDADLSEDLLKQLDLSLPTLILAECVFIYLEPRVSNGILAWFLDKFKHAGLMAVLYDPVGLDDAFGRVMIDNLKARGLQLHGLEANISTQAQARQLKDLGFTHCYVRDVRTIRKEDLPQNESERLRNLEMLDEVEELDLILSHYSISWAYVQPRASMGTEIGSPTPTSDELFRITSINPSASK